MVYLTEEAGTHVCPLLAFRLAPWAKALKIGAAGTRASQQKRTEKGRVEGSFCEQPEEALLSWQQGAGASR